MFHKDAYAASGNILDLVSIPNLVLLAVLLLFYRCLQKDQGASSGGFSSPHPLSLVLSSSLAACRLLPAPGAILLHAGIQKPQAWPGDILSARACGSFFRFLFRILYGVLLLSQVQKVSDDSGVHNGDHIGAFHLEDTVFHP